MYACACCMCTAAFGCRLYTAWSNMDITHTYVCVDASAEAILSGRRAVARRYACTAHFEARAQPHGRLHFFPPMLDHDGSLGMEQRCSCRSPSKLAISYIVSIRVLRTQASHRNDVQVRSLDQRHFLFKNSRYGLATGDAHADRAAPCRERTFEISGSGSLFSIQRTPFGLRMSNTR